MLLLPTLHKSIAFINSTHEDIMTFSKKYVVMINPAKTFIGDTGSNFLGYSLAVISILGVAKTYTALVLIAPIIVLAVPIFDTLFAIVRRIVKGKSIKAILSPDKGHLHHRLMAKGYT